MQINNTQLKRTKDILSKITTSTVTCDLSTEIKLTDSQQIAASMYHRKLVDNSVGAFAFTSPRDLALFKQFVGVLAVHKLSANYTAGFLEVIKACLTKACALYDTGASKLSEKSELRARLVVSKKILISGKDQINSLADSAVTSYEPMDIVSFVTMISCAANLEKVMARAKFTVIDMVKLDLSIDEMTACVISNWITEAKLPVTWVLQ